MEKKKNRYKKDTKSASFRLLPLPSKRISPPQGRHRATRQMAKIKGYFMANEIGRASFAMK